MYKFEPILKEVIWGGERIAAYKGIATASRTIGESWELSAVAGCESVVSEGAERGMTLTRLVDRHGAALVGRRNFERFGNRFPLLVKFIDAHRDLSIQVHPDDVLAQRRHGSCGKSEMWYIIGAEHGAHLMSGFSRRIGIGEYERRVADNTLTEVLADYRVSAGDLFYIPAGRVHTIGAGTFLVEIQQSSDITYRIYDYGRDGSDGRPRELHTELAREAIDFSVKDDYRTHYTAAKGRGVELLTTPHFTANLYELTAPHGIDLSDVDSFVAVICLEGSARLAAGDGPTMEIRQGETVLVPASAAHLAIDTAGVKLLTASV